MKRALLLGWKDCVVRFQSRAVLMFVIVLPLAMVIVTGLAFQGLELTRVVAEVAVAADRSPVAERFRAALDEWPRQPASGTRGHEETEPSPSDVVLREDVDRVRAEAMLAAGELDGLVVLTSEGRQAGDRVELFVASRTSPERLVVESAVRAAVQDVLAAAPLPLETHEVEGEGSQRRGPPPGFSSFSQAVAGNGVMFILMNCMTTGGVALVRERRNNTLARLLISPMTKGEIVFGKTLGVYFVGVVQAVVVFAFGVLVVGVELGSLVGVTAITLLFILVGCAFGLVISAIARREEAVEAIGAPAALVMTALGGGMFPVELAPEWMQVTAKLFPTGWAMEGYHRLMWYGEGLGDVLVHIGVLAVWAVVLLMIGIWKLRWD